MKKPRFTNFRDWETWSNLYYIEKTLENARLEGWENAAQAYTIEARQQIARLEAQITQLKSLPATRTAQIALMQAATAAMGVNAQILSSLSSVFDNGPHP